MERRHRHNPSPPPIFPPPHLSIRRSASDFDLEDIISMINDMGIVVYESADAAPDADELLHASDNTPDEVAADEAAAALAAVETEAGRTTDPVRMERYAEATREDKLAARPAQAVPPALGATCNPRNLVHTPISINGRCWGFRKWH